MLLSQVALAVGLDSEGVVADAADVRPLPAVCAQVADQRGLVRRHIVANVALVGEDSQVEAHVSLQDAGEGEHFVAEAAGVRAFDRAGAGPPFGPRLPSSMPRLLVHGRRVGDRGVTQAFCIHLSRSPG